MNDRMSQWTQSSSNPIGLLIKIFRYTHNPVRLAFGDLVLVIVHYQSVNDNYYGESLIISVMMISKSE